MNNIYVYRHRRLDNFKVFYIGIGYYKRAYSKTSRNKYWRNITNKIDYQVEILSENLTWQDACELEMLLISEYGRKDNNTGILCNLTDGGEGSLGLTHTLNTKLKMKNSHSKPWLNRKHTQETKLKMSNSNLFSKKVICTKTSKIWNSITDCAKENNLKYNTLRDYLNQCYTNKTNFKYLENGY